jgi:hypothetical protein
VVRAFTRRGAAERQGRVFAKDHELMTKDQRARHWRPSLETLEVRDVLSSLAVHAASTTREATSNLNSVIAREMADYGGISSADLSNATTAKSRGTPAWVNESFLQSLVSQLYGPITTTEPITVGNQTFPPGTYSVPQPNSREIQRQTYWMEFEGTYTVGPPRFSNQASTIHIYSDGRSVTSNQFLNGRAQLLIFPPKDPTAAPTTLDPVAGLNTGLMSVFAANILQSGSVLFAEVSNVPGVSSNAPSTLNHGLPSQLEFTIDPGGLSGGIYSTPLYSTTPDTVTNADTGQAIPLIGGSGGAVASNQGAGLVDITYIPTRGPHGVASQSGKVIVRVQGLINTTGVLNPIYAGIN